jgi:hypothetical protein
MLKRDAKNAELKARVAKLEQDSKQVQNDIPDKVCFRVSTDNVSNSEF